jgi:hypothetical protein
MSHVLHANSVRGSFLDEQHNSSSTTAPATAYTTITSTAAQVVEIMPSFVTNGWRKTFWCAAC